MESLLLYWTCCETGLFIAHTCLKCGVPSWRTKTELPRQETAGQNKLVLNG